MKIAFLNATCFTRHPTKKNRPCGANFSRRVRNLARRPNRKTKNRPGGTWVLYDETDNYSSTKVR
jgi:hypothetical protein